MGYIGNKRSERSQEAINNGLVTKSQLKAWQKRAVGQGVVSSCEWHHTGKYFNVTEYYDLNDFKDLKKEDFPPVKKENKKEEVEVYYVLVSAVWGGTKRYPKIVDVDVQITTKLSSYKRACNKYNLYGGYIKEFSTYKDALEFSRTAKLK